MNSDFNNIMDKVKTEILETQKKIDAVLDCLPKGKQVNKELGASISRMQRLCGVLETMLKAIEEYYKIMNEGV